MRIHIRSTCAAALSLLVAVSLSACAPSAVVGGLFGTSHCSVGPITFTVTDTSGSTAAERVRGGLYERAEMAAAMKAAADCGDLYATTADGNSLADSRWTIDDARFRLAIGSDEVSRAGRVQSAKKLRPAIRRLLGETTTAGTDVLGALTRVSLAVPAATNHAGRTIQVVVQTDGVLNVSGAYDLYRIPIDTPGRRAAFISRLEGAGELPDLKGAEVTLFGVGVGVGDRRLARSVVALWAELVAHMNGRLVSLDAATPGV
jgi:hypothetical protein